MDADIHEQDNNGLTALTKALIAGEVEDLLRTSGKGFGAQPRPS